MLIKCWIITIETDFRRQRCNIWWYFDPLLDWDGQPRQTNQRHGKNKETGVDGVKAHQTNKHLSYRQYQFNLDPPSATLD